MPEQDEVDNRIHISISESQWEDMEMPDLYKNFFRTLAIDLKKERLRNKELQTQLEIMTHHRNRLLNKRDGHDTVCPACKNNAWSNYSDGLVCKNAFHELRQRS